MLEQEWYLTNDQRVLDEDAIMAPSALFEPDVFSREPGELLIVALGDSFTEGYPVFGDGAYPAVLERE